MYELTLDRLAAAGYRQYEISNFARPGCECRHNRVYWQNEPYLGFGISAASFVERERWSNTPSTRVYRERVEAGLSAGEPGERLEGRSAVGEALMLGLRLNEGVDLGQMSARYECDVPELFHVEFARWINHGLLEATSDHRLRLTRAGLLLSNNVFADLI
jgi:oxygen-independent coproporphyrinogen III oxidase